MTEREKEFERKRLVELLIKGSNQPCGNGSPWEENYCEGCKYENQNKCRDLQLADYLLEHNVVALPCSVGDCIYHLRDIYKGKKRLDTIIEPITVDSFVFGDSGTLQINTCDNSRNEWIYYSATDFGRCVFLTREEAEKALEEIKNEHSK